MRYSEAQRRFDNRRASTILAEARFELNAALLRCRVYFSARFLKYRFLSTIIRSHFPYAGDPAFIEQTMEGPPHIGWKKWLRRP